MDGFFVAKLKKFAPGERRATSTSAGVPDTDAPEANEAGGSADGMDVDNRLVRSFFVFRVEDETFPYKAASTYL